MKKLLYSLFTVCLLAGCTTANPNEYLLGTWLRPSPSNPRITEGFTLAKKGHAISINLGQTKYNAWRISDGNLVLSGVDSSAGASILISDTFTIQNVDSSMLVLTDQNGKTAYYTRQK